MILKVENTENFENKDVENLRDHLAKQMEENLGMAMVFTLVSAAQEWLNVQWDEIKLHREETRVKKIIEEEEAERVCCSNKMKINKIKKENFNNNDFLFYFRRNVLKVRELMLRPL